MQRVWGKGCGWCNATISVTQTYSPNSQRRSRYEIHPYDLARIVYRYIVAHRHRNYPFQANVNIAHPLISQLNSKAFCLVISLCLNVRMIFFAQRNNVS